MADQVKPFMVQTADGTKVIEVSTQREADSSAQERNREAERLGIKARYVGTANPAYRG